MYMYIYLHRYDRQKLTLKEIHNVQYVACMNPTAGSFTINSRLQRHFSVFAVSFPGKKHIRTYGCMACRGKREEREFREGSVRERSECGVRKKL